MPLRALFLVIIVTPALFQHSRETLSQKCFNKVADCLQRIYIIKRRSTTDFGRKEVSVVNKLSGTGCRLKCNSDRSLTNQLLTSSVDR